MPKKKWFWNDITDGLLRRLYDPTVRGRSQEIAARLKVPRWAVNRRAAALGLSRPKDRPWSAEDEAYVDASFHHTSVKTLARKLGRSPTAVQLKAKRLVMRDAMAQLNRGRDGSLVRLADEIEAFDIATFGHVGRVAAYAYVIGKELGLPPAALRRLVLAAQMHDIGKIGLPPGAADEARQADGRRIRPDEDSHR